MDINMTLSLHDYVLICTALHNMIKEAPTFDLSNEYQSLLRLMLDNRKDKHI